MVLQLAPVQAFFRVMTHLTTNPPRLRITLIIASKFLPLFTSAPQFRELPRSFAV